MSEGGAAQQWASVEALFQEALLRAPSERAAWLVQACPDAALRAEVESLLGAHDRPGVVDALAEELMAPLLAPPPAPGAAPPVLTRYRIVDRIGGGGMGVVYRARDERLGREVALKFLPPHLSADLSAKRRFLVEARAAAALEHPNICTVHEIGDTEDGQLYIVMACYEGEALDRRIARGPLPLDAALAIAEGIARGLERAHERGIVHRDIKPANVMLTADGPVKLLDFGIAKLADVTGTHTVGAIGTLAYMSPEQAFGEAVDHRTDLWSLGVVLYEMLTGVRPFRGAGDQPVLFAILSADPEPVSRLRPDVPVALDAVLARALAKTPAERFATAAEFRAALDACRGLRAGGPVAARRAPAAAPVTGALAGGGERRPVTVAVSTLEGATALAERLAGDLAEQVHGRLRDAATAVATRYGGVLNAIAPDGMTLLFGAVEAHEDDAVRGVRAALELHERVVELAATLPGRLPELVRLRTGVHSGAAIAQPTRGGTHRYRLTGAPVDIATRLAAAAEPDAVLVSAETRRLVAPFVFTAAAPALPPTAAGDPVQPHRVLGASDVRSRLEAAARTGLTPFVGRARERGALADHLTAARAGDGRVTVLVGEAGAGKSRLLHELRGRAAAEGMRVLLGRCDAHGGSTPFLPFVEAAEAVLDVPRGGAPAEQHDAVVAAVRAIDPSLERYLPLYLALLAIPSATHPVPEHLRGELFQSAMREAIAALFSAGARATPTLLLLEDWHWADEASRVALPALADIVPAGPLLLVVTSRPDPAADWGSADHLAVLHLAPLDAAASSAIACAVLGAARVEPDLLGRLHERTGGNPFFLEELCSALREAGAVHVAEGEARLAATAGDVQVPETVHGVLRTRLDRLDPEARDVLRIAAVLGRDFARGLLEAVAAPAPVAAPLDRLKLSGLIQQVALVPEPLYRFKHALTQEVTYDSLLEHQRAGLHEAAGRAIEARHAGRLDEHVDRLAHHFGRAEAWPEAVRYGMLAAERAIALAQYADALATLERVEEWLRRLPDDADRRDRHADVLLQQERCCEALGFRARQLGLVESLVALLAPHGPSPRLARAYLRQGDACTLLRRFEAADRALATAAQIAADLGDDAGERNALRSLAFLRSHEGRHTEALALIEEVLALGRAAGDLQAEAGDAATMANILRALGRHHEALAALEGALARTPEEHNPIRHGALLNVIATVHRDLGDYATALDYFRRTAGLLTHPQYASFTLPAIAYIQLQQGDVEASVATYREAVAMNRKARYADGLANSCRSLGEVLVGLDRLLEAVPPLREAAALFAQLEDRPNEALMWRRLAGVHERLDQPAEARAAWERARALVAGGDPALEAEVLEGIARAVRGQAEPPDAAIARYRDALALATRAGDRARELRLRNALGIVHWQQGRYGEALAEYEVALRLCRALGDRVHEGLILNSLGATLHRLRRWDEARIALADGVRAAEATGELRLRAHALGLLGEVCHDAGRLEEARAALEASLALRPALEDARGAAWMHARLARVRHALGDAAGAARDAAAAAASAAAREDPALRALLDTLPLPGAPAGATAG